MPLALKTQRQLAGTRTSAQSRCSTWFDIGLAAFACSPKDLARAYRDGTLAKHGQFTLLVAGHRTGAAPGLVQVVGSRLKAGDTVRLRGKPAKDEIIILNTLRGKQELLIKITRIHTRPHATIKLVADGKRVRPLLHDLTAAVAITVVRPKKQHS